MTRIIALFALTLTAACTESGDGPTDPSSADVVVVDGLFEGSLGAGALAGIEICGPDGTCVVTDDSGEFQLEQLAGTDIVLEATGRSDYSSYLIPLPLQDEDRHFRARVASKDIGVLIRGQLEYISGVSIDDTLGRVVVQARGSATHCADGISDVEGVEFSLQAPGAIGPFYLGDLGIDAELTSTGPMGEAQFANVSVGDHVLVAMHPSLECTVLTGLTSDDGTLVVPAQAGFITLIEVVCR